VVIISCQINDFNSITIAVRHANGYAYNVDFWDKYSEVKFKISTEDRPTSAGDIYEIKIKVTSVNPMRDTMKRGYIDTCLESIDIDYRYIPIYMNNKNICRIYIKVHVQSIDSIRM